MKEANPDGHAIVRYSCHTFCCLCIPGVSALHAATKGSDRCHTRGRAGDGYNQSGCRSHRLLCLLVALYRQRSAFASAPAPLCYINFDLRWSRLSADLALLEHASALVRLAAHYWHTAVRLCA